MKFFKCLIVVGLFLLIYLSSCQKEQVCGVNNPIKDLPWLNQLTKDVRQGGLKYRVNIYQCSYRDGTGFLINMCAVGCYDAGLQLKNCEGENLCLMWGEGGYPCTEFNIEKTKLIWKN